MRRILMLCCGLSLAGGFLTLASQEVLDGAAESESAAADARAARRSFTGAPPTIPHPVSRRDNKECLTCHTSVQKTQFGISNITPHPHFRSCQQCHVGTQGLNKELVVPEVPNSFEGWVGDTEGFRASETAPPTVPHGLFLRENCISCHSPDHPDERLRSPHYRQVNCRQCHVQQNPEF